MQSDRDPELEKRVALTLDLFAAAEEMMRQNLRREFPAASAREIERRLRDWYLDDRGRRPPAPEFREIPPPST
ncbi:MAG: hypothetical protein U0X73_11180 [Thermoanaerobaculia bacterium]